YFLGVQSTWQTLGYRVWGLAALGVLVSWSWWVALLVLVGVVSTNVTWSRYSEQIFEQIFRDRRRRRARWYHRLLVEQGNAKEVRLFGLTAFGLERFSASWQAALTDLWTARDNARRPIYAALSLVFLAYAVALTMLARDAWVGAITTGTMLAAAQALVQVQGLGMIG